MSNEDLMKPRFKVIATYPGCPYHEGELIEIGVSGNVFYGIETKDGEHWVPVSALSTWTANFKKLEWWEERDKADMPKYVKYNADLGAGVKSAIGDVVKVYKWWPGNGGISYESGGGTLANYLLPATKE